MKEGSGVSFSVTASGTVPLSYQWYRDNSAVAGATRTSYTISAAQPSDAGDYKVRVINVAGSVDSAVATLTVQFAPFITEQPQSQTMIVSDIVTFTVAAGGVPAPSYQWRRNGVNISGATSGTYTISNVQTNQAGNYTVVVSNASGTATSATAGLIVNVPPSIAAQPQNQSVTAGNSVAFSVTASGTAPLSYQWYRNNSAIAGATVTRYTISAAQPSDAGDYKVRVINVAGSVDSAVATLTAQFAPFITEQPQSQTVIVGDIVTFTVAAGGVPAPSYQWRRNGVNISGPTSGTYTISNVQTNQAGNYTVVVSNASGTATSATAGLIVNVPPSIAAQPQNQSVTAGNSVAFSVTASGTAPLSYQWYRNNSAIAGATVTRYTISAAQPSDAGSYDVIVSNNYGSVTSAVATLTLQCAPIIITQPRSQTVNQGASVSFSVEASAVPTPTFQWRLNAALITGATSSVFTLTNVQPSDAGNYIVIISNAMGQTNSATASLNVLVPLPGIYDTGLSDSRTLLGDGQVDPHYKLVVNPNNPASSYSVVQDSTAWPIVGGPWVQNSSISKWIGPAFNTVGVAAGNYSYQLAVDLTGYDPRTTFLAGSWAADDTGSIFLNGEDTGFSSTNYFVGFSTFTLTNGFVLGTNLIEFRISNAASPTGLRVENLQGTLQTETVPFVGTQPESATNVIGDNVTFAVVAGGASPLRYQWRFNGADIPTASGASLELTNAQLNQAGNYDVIVSNNYGSVTSAVATLMVGIWADVYYDFETAATSPVWLGTTQMIQDTSASHQGTNAIALTGAYPNGYVLTELPQGTTNVEFYFYDECGPNPAGSQYMFFRLLEATNSTAFAGFSMLDGGWGTTPPMTMNHYYAYANEEYSARTMGPLRTVGWHKFTFAVDPESVAMSVDGALIFETNMIGTARYLELQCGDSGGWGRIDDLVLKGVTFTQPTLTVSRAGNGIRVAWPASATGFVLQETSSPPGSWTDSSAAVVVQGNENVAVIETTGTLKLYRLQK